MVPKTIARKGLRDRGSSHAPSRVDCYIFTKHRLICGSRRAVVIAPVECRYIKAMTAWKDKRLWGISSAQSERRPYKPCQPRSKAGIPYHLLSLYCKNMGGAKFWELSTEKGDPPENNQANPAAQCAEKEMPCQRQQERYSDET